MVTILEIRNQARQRADMVNSQFVADSELLGFINNSYAELFDLLVATDQDYYLLSETFTIPGGDNTYALPVDFYKIKGIDRQRSAGNTDWESVGHFVFAERNKYNLYPNVTPCDALRYRVTGNVVRFIPETQAEGTYRLWYIPRATTFTLDTDILDGVNGFEEYVIVDTAIKMLQKEESDVSVLMVQKENLKRRIQAMAADRDMGSPETVSDVSSQFYRLSERFFI